MIKLTDLLNEETFTATKKDTGKTSVFKSKAARDAAVKAGTHSKKDSKDGADKDQADKPKVNIFKRDSDKDSKKNILKMKKDREEKEFNSLYNSDDFDEKVDSLKDKMSDEDFKQIKDAIENLKYMQYDLEDIDRDEDNEEWAIQSDAIDVEVEDLKGLIKQAINKDKEEPKSEPKKSEPSKYDSEYFADDEKSDSVGYDSDTGDTYYDDDDEALVGYKKTVERLNKVEKALDDELKLSDNGFTTARQSGGGGGYYEGPLEIYGDNAIDDDGYPREGAVTLSIGSGENDGNFSIALTSLEDGMNVFDGPYSITGDRELSAEESFKLGKTLMKMPEMQKLLKGEISKEEFQPIYTKLVSKFGKSTKNETTMKLKNLLPVNEGKHKKFERQLKALQKIIKIDLEESLEMLEEDGVLESIDLLEIAVERLQGMIKDLKRIR